MCGIIGIIGKGEVSHDLYNALFTLQHRGQDGAGILTFDEDRAYMKKGAGLIYDVSDGTNLVNLKGNAGIGHVRYPTAGLNSSEDIQPFFVNFPCGIGMAHNGNVVNYHEIKKKLKNEHQRTLTSKCDVEVILNLFASVLSNNHSKQEPGQIFSAVENVMKEINGAYSVVATILNKGLLAFRDPKGIKPLVFGKKGKGYAFSSESVALDVLGYKVIKDVEPGEAVFVDMDLNVHSKRIATEKPAHCMFEWVYFARPDSTIENESVYQTRLRLGKELALEWKKKRIDVDVVMPVPDTSRAAALSFATEINKPYREGLIKNRYVGRTFIMATQESRKRAVKSKLNPMIHEIKGKKIALVDDSLVRGTTSEKLINLIRGAGAEEVHFLLTCPPITNPCFYGTDMQTKKELMAPDKTIEEIRKKIGADSLTYQTIEGLKRAIGLDLCAACLNGNYPTNITEEMIKEIEKTRKEEHDRMRIDGA